MTLTTILGLLAFGVFLFLMMKKGCGCCGGYNHGSHGQEDQDCANHNQGEHHHQKALEDDDNGPQKDPVCGMTVDKNSLASEHQGRTFHFCSAQCRKAFELAPLKYTDSTKICR